MLGGRAFGGRSGHEARALLNGISDLLPRTWDSPPAPSAAEDPARRRMCVDREAGAQRTPDVAGSELGAGTGTDLGPLPFRTGAGMTHADAAGPVRGGLPLRLTLTGRGAGSARGASLAAHDADHAPGPRALGRASLLPAHGTWPSGDCSACSTATHTF